VNWVSIIIAVVQLVAAVALQPRVKKTKPPTAQQAESPTTGAGPTPMIFGTVRLKEPKVLWSGDKSIHTYDISA
jgi:flagellar basal body-associated protein FliL